MAITVNTEEPLSITVNETDTMKSIIQNIKMILGTIRGTCPLDREFGIDGTVIDKPLSVARPLILSDIKDTVEKYEPRCSVLGVSFSESSTPGSLISSVEVEINE